MTRPRFAVPPWLVCACVALAAASLSLALDPKSQANSVALAEREFFKPELQISSSHVAEAALGPGLANREAWERLRASVGGPAVAWFDPRSGTPSSIATRVPMIPGRGNDLALAQVTERLGRPVSEVDSRVVGDLVRQFVETNKDALAIDPTQLGPAKSTHVADELWQISIPQTVQGVPVRHGRIVATVNHGNLILLGTDTWGNVRVDVTPRLTAEQAVELGFAWAGGKSNADKLWAKPALEILPLAPPDRQAGESFAGPVGTGYGHRLAWVFGFTRSGEDAAWEMQVDAHSGEILAFADQNQYEAKRISGGIYPLTSTGICPTAATCGTMQADSPMPWANTGLSAPNDFTNSAGVFEYPGSGNVTTTLSGRYVRIVDSCGAISVVSPTGDIDLAGLNDDHDCTSGGGSAGNTAAARSAFYEVNKLAEMARGWLPSNTWLQQQLTANVNLAQTCNAFYTPSGGTINFYRSGGGCRNTGEIAAVFDHEWGHALDDNDSAGALSNSSEAYADIAAIYRLQSSCVGYGFFQTIDDGCGMTADGTGFNVNESQNGTHCATNCSGVRDADWALHTDGTPDTPVNFVCGQCGSGSGPCGRQVHCAAAPARQAAWDLAARDLQAPPFNMSAIDAFITANKIFYQGSGNVGSWHACSCPSSADGCGATNAYMQWLAADDDNGNLADGTPHMTAIFAAFDRHGIACATPTPQNGGCSGGPTAAPTLTAEAGSNQVSLSWTAVPGASTYRVLRTEGYAGCAFGKAVIAQVGGLSFSDTGVGNGRDYSYVVQAVGSSGACFGPSSACVTATPQPCAGSVSLDRDVFNCSDTISIALIDSDLVGGGSHAVEVRSTTEAAPETVVLSESPAASGRFTGSIGTTIGAVAQDGLVSVSHADTITVEYLDLSSCGTPNVTVARTATVDCQGPVITSVLSSNVTGNSAEISWNTDEAADSSVTYGTSLPPGTSTPVAPALVTARTVRLTGLAECSTYYYSVRSTDPAGNSASDDDSGAYFDFETGSNVSPSYLYSGPPVPIPDNNPTGATASVSVSDVNVIQDVDVKIHLTHTYDGDLVLSLIGPDGTSVVLANHRGGSGNDFIDTIFDDEATTPILSGAAPFTGIFRPDAPLTAFDGKNPAGNWSFKVVDSAGVDVGSIIGFELRLTYPPQACGPALAYQSHSLSDQCASGAGDENSVVEPGETLAIPVTLRNSGTGPTTGISATLTTTTPGVSVISGAVSYPDLAVGQSAPGSSAFTVQVSPSLACGTQIELRVDADANEGDWDGTFTLAVGAPGGSVTTYDATGLPQPIPDVSTTTSTIAVASSQPVLDVDIGLTLTHTFDADLDITLIAPNGSRIGLSSDNGSSGDNFTGTIFDDEAATAITAGSAPFTGRFRPEGLLNLVDGIPSNGTWTLEIVDDAGSDVGNLLAWSLTLSTAGSPICQTCESLAPPAEVLSVSWGDDKETLEWLPTGGATSYNVYRGDPGDLASLHDSNIDSCQAATTSTTETTLGLVPAADSFHWYLVRAVNGVGEGTIGAGTPGPRIHDPSGPCP